MLPATWMWTPPVAVNLTAFDTRLATTCLIRVVSPNNLIGTSAAQLDVSSRPLLNAWTANCSLISATSARRSRTPTLSVILPASSLEKSRTALSISRTDLTPWLWIARELLALGGNELFALQDVGRAHQALQRRAHFVAEVRYESCLGCDGRCRAFTGELQRPLQSARPAGAEADDQAKA